MVLSCNNHIYSSTFFLGCEGGGQQSSLNFNTGLYIAYNWIISRVIVFLGVFFLTQISYLLFNFNDYPNGMVALFNLLVSGIWGELMEVYVLSLILATFNVIFCFIIMQWLMRSTNVAGLPLLFCAIWFFCSLNNYLAIRILLFWFRSDSILLKNKQDNIISLSLIFVFNT